MSYSVTSKNIDFPHWDTQRETEILGALPMLMCARAETVLVGREGRSVHEEFQKS
jgi:hypothetical protein